MTPTSRPQCAPVLETTEFDRVTSSLLAILFCLGLLAFALSSVWFFNLEPPPPGTRLLQGIEVLGGSSSITAHSLDVLPPEEITDDPSVHASPSVAAEVLAMVERLGELEPSEVQEPGVASGTGTDKRAGTGSSVVPPTKSNPERWFFNIDCEENADTYARLLEELDIQLGAFEASGTSTFCYLSELSNSRPKVRRVSTGKDDRFYTVWQQGTLTSLDRELFRRAGISPRGQAIHFFSHDLEAQLSQMELDAARRAGRRSKDIRRTYFSIARKPDGSYGFEVDRQSFR